MGEGLAVKAISFISNQNKISSSIEVSEGITA